MYFQPGQKSHVSIPKRRLQGGILFILIAIIAYFSAPKPNIKVTNLSGKTIQVSIQTDQNKLQHQLKDLQTWRINQSLSKKKLLISVQFIKRKTVTSVFKDPTYPLSLSVSDNGNIKKINQ